MGLKAVILWCTLRPAFSTLAQKRSRCHGQGQGKDALRAQYPRVSLNGDHGIEPSQIVLEGLIELFGFGPGWHDDQGLAQCELLPCELSWPKKTHVP